MWELQSGESPASRHSPYLPFRATSGSSPEDYPALACVCLGLRWPRRRPKQLSMSLVDQIFLIQDHPKKRELIPQYKESNLLPMDSLQLLKHVGNEEYLCGVSSHTSRGILKLKSVGVNIQCCSRKME